MASYRVSHGCEILIQPDAGALEQDVRGYLLGSIFAVLCHQRGLLPLHASAVAYQGGVAAFLANSGHGKSSMAAHLAGRGFPVVADDVCLVDVRGEGASRGRTGRSLAQIMGRFSGASGPPGRGIGADF